jgi:hypothetical protein
MAELTLEQLNARATEAARASASMAADSVIVRVNCAGETKKIELATNATVRDAIETCRRKFKFIETAGFQLYLAFPADVQVRTESKRDETRFVRTFALSYSFPLLYPIIAQRFRITRTIQTQVQRRTRL